jgi:energy-coupling factor transporter transmembrane protein EcfT
MDELSAGDSLVHQLHPGAKLLATLAFVIVTASFPKYEIAAMIPLFLYPLFLISLADLPWGLLLRRLLVSLPFVVFIGAFNPLFDQAPLYQIGSLSLSGGMVSYFHFAAILFVSAGCISSYRDNRHKRVGSSGTSLWRAAGIGKSDSVYVPLSARVNGGSG